MTTNFDSSTPLAYTGLSQTVNPPTISVNRAPTVNDWQSFNPGDLWRDTSTFPPITYILASVNGNVAIWQALIGTPPGGIQTINHVGPDLSGDFEINAGASISITPGVNSVTIASTGGDVSSVSGTAAQIDVAPNTGDVVVSIDPAYVGQISIDTLGTIDTGTWNANIISGEYGGTGVANTGQTIDLSSFAAGDVLTSDAGGNATWQPASAGAVSSVSGTVNQIDVVPTTGACVVSIDPAYVGQVSIDTLGTVTTGTWNGNVVTGQYGGTGVANTGLTINLGAGSLGKVLTSDAGGNAAWQASGGIGSITKIVRTVFTYTGSPQTYTPYNVGGIAMKFADVEVIGGGGGGGGNAATGALQVAAGGGGAGGGYAKGLFTAAQIGVSQTVTVGAGGLAGTGTGVFPVYAGTGGSTAVGALISATGGGGGENEVLPTQYNAVALGGLPGFGSGGNFQASGCSGGNADAMYNTSPNYYFGFAGDGGASFLGGSIRGRLFGASGPGEPGRSYGAGSSGALSLRNTARTLGAAGIPGIVIITEYCS